jgi:hypothetical protein
MSGEIKSWWQALIVQLEKDRFFNKRYSNCAKEPKAIFNRIGEDLDSSSESIRNTACWTLVHLTPELTDYLHEKETREPGWRDKEGKDQQMVNECMDGSKDIIKHLHTKLVKEHGFKVRDGDDGKDPRPYLKKIIKNWKKDGDRKRRNRDGNLREVPLDYEAALEIPDPAGSPEDYVLKKTELKELECAEKELLKLKFYRSEEERALFRTIYIDESPLTEVLESYGIPSHRALQQRLSRSRKNFVAVRDELMSFLLIMWGEFYKKGKIPRFPEASDWWIDRVKNAVQPGAWLMGESANGENCVAVRPLTRALCRAPVHIYLVAVHKVYLHEDDDLIDEIKDKCKGKKEIFQEQKAGAHFDAHVRRYADILITLATKGTQPRNYIYCPLTAYPTAIPALNETLAEVRDDYNVLLLSNLIPFHPYLLEEILTIAPNDSDIDFDTWAKRKPVPKYPEYRPYIDNDDFTFRLLTFS